MTTKRVTSDGKDVTISAIIPPQDSSEETPPRSIHSLEDLIGEKLGKHKIDVYRGVVIFWSGKASDDVFEFIDHLKPGYRGRLVLLRLQNDELSLAWRGTVPEDLGEGTRLIGPSEDQEWDIARSVQVA
jgi:hypothetical protein